jgi:enoyl-CoA hydratase/carnithine racemase
VSIGMTPARLGVVYPPPGLRRFLHLVGPARAREIFFTARPVAAERALAIGLVDRVLPAAEAEAAAFALAAEIAGNAPLAVQGMKRVFRLLEASAERGLTDDERAEVEELRRRAFESDDVREGRAAFLEKRAPRFSGR